MACRSLALVLGSARHGRPCDVVADWVEARLGERADRTIERIDPFTLALSLGDPPLSDTGWATLETRLDRAEAMLVLCAESNRGYPAALKQIIDATSASWQGKPVGLIGYGGPANGRHGIVQLRQVMAALDAVTIDPELTLADLDRRLVGGRELSATPAEDRRLDRLAHRLDRWHPTTSASPCGAQTRRPPRSWLESVADRPAGTD